MKRLISLFTLLVAMAWGLNSAQAVNINLLNVQTAAPETNPLANMYGQAYGFTPQQVAPAMMAPPQEVPGILQIAQAAGQVPMSVFMMRKMGMSFPSILSTFALAPSVLGGGAAPLLGANPYGPNFGNQYPVWTRVLNPFLIETSRVTFLRDVLHVKPQFIPLIPYGGRAFNEALLRPYHPVYGTWMPPGIAKKYGLWMPPGQAKKVGWLEHDHKHKHGWKEDKHYWKGDKHHWDHDSVRELHGEKVHFSSGKSKEFHRGPDQAKAKGGSKGNPGQGNGKGKNK